MNARERLFAVLNGEPVDRTPVWLLFPYHATSYYVDVRALPAWRAVHEAAMQYAITLNRRTLGARLFSPEVKISVQQNVDGVTRIYRQEYEYKHYRLWSETSVSPTKTRIKKLLETDEDLEIYCKLPINTDRQAINSELDKQLDKYLLEKKEFPIELGSMMLDLGEPVNNLYHSSQLEEFAIWSITSPDLINDFLDRVMVHRIMIYQYCLERNLADCYFMVGSELAAPPMVSISTFRRWIMPYTSEIIDQIHRRGCKVIQHFHGQVKELLPEFVAMGADALHTIEAPPVGNCYMNEAFKIVGDKMALIGNIQYDDFRSFSKDEMRQAVTTLLEENIGKKFILSPSAGPYDVNVSKSFLENYLVMLETAWNFKQH